MSEPFTRQSTVQELATTVPGRAFRAMVLRQLPPTSSEEERQALEDMTVALPMQTLVELSEGKLPWGLADSVIDLANGKPHRLVPRGLDAGKGVLQKVTRAVRR